MKQTFFEIEKHDKIARDVFKMILRGDCSEITAPGQFVNLEIDGFYLRRPISVCDVTGDQLTIVYKVLGEGTKKMSTMQIGEGFDTLIPLGNGYDLNRCGETTLLLGGGVGTPPMYLLCKKLLEMGKKPTVVLGFNSKADVFFGDEFTALGVTTCIATADGTLGVKGFVTDIMKHLTFSDICACGPIAMLKAVYDAAEVPGQFSFEERMGCGFGACMGCSCKTKYGYKRICRDGPVLFREEIIW